MATTTAALFDLDGVIIDTEPQYTTFWDTIRQKYYPNNPDFALSVKGQTLVYILDKFFTEPADGQAVREALDNFEAQMQYPFVSGALHFVTALREAGIPTAVVTSSDKTKMKNVYSQHPQLASLFTAILTAEDTSRSKPAPDCYLIAAKRLGADITQSVVFEDSFNGLKAGRASGAKVIGLSTTNSPDAIAPLSDLVISDFSNFTVADVRHLLDR